ncbi:MAG: restriction endonuclease subunit S [Deltaproteobacteria bacterium]|nr:restriction endonuclease subunit S [Deltaproteobacteria bacterium]
MRAKLKDVASIQLGFSFRARLESAENGPIAVIQMKDITEGGSVDCGDLVRVAIDGLKEHHLAKVGDLVFRSRGLSHGSAILSDDPGAVIVAAPLFRIRVVDPLVVPNYLNWFLNQRSALNYFGSCMEGTVQKMINKAALENLEVSVPSLERQSAIVEIADLINREQELMSRLAVKRKLYFSEKLIEVAKGEGNR